MEGSSALSRAQSTRGEVIMRHILAAVLALSMLAGATGSALAVDEDFPRDFWSQQQRNLP